MKMLIEFKKSEKCGNKEIPITSFSESVVRVNGVPTHEFRANVQEDMDITPFLDLIDKEIENVKIFDHENKAIYNSGNFKSIDSVHKGSFFGGVVMIDIKLLIKER